MSSFGYIQVHAYTSRARIPLEDTAIAITDPDGKAIALRLTNQSGILDKAVEIPVPALEAGLTPDTGVLPFSEVNLYARRENYQEIEVTNLQIFPNTVTNQDLEFIPLPELPDSFIQGDIYNTVPQNL